WVGSARAAGAGARRTAAAVAAVTATPRLSIAAPFDLPGRNAVTVATATGATQPPEVGSCPSPGSGGLAGTHRGGDPPQRFHPSGTPRRPGERRGDVRSVDDRHGDMLRPRRRC